MTNSKTTDIPLPSRKVIDLLRYSCSELPSWSPELGKSLYRNLFQVTPDIRDVFASSDLEEQRQRTTDALLRVIHHFDEPHEVANHLQRLGAAHHEHLGVRPDHYPHIGRAMVRAVSDVSPTWSSSTSSAWVPTYQWVTAHTLTGAQMALGAKKAAAEGAATARHADRAHPRSAHRHPEGSSHGHGHYDRRDRLRLQKRPLKTDPESVGKGLRARSRHRHSVQYTPSRAVLIPGTRPLPSARNTEAVKG